MEHNNADDMRAGARIKICKMLLYTYRGRPSMGVVEGVRSEMKNFEDPRGMRVYVGMCISGVVNCKYF